MDQQTDDTLPDDAWKDSFDKLLDQRPILREKNVIKRDVRASFNMNSSFENSGYENSTIVRQDLIKETKQNKACGGQLRKITSPVNAQYLDVPKNIKENNKNIQCMVSDIVSTPIKNKTTTNPFKCTLSPIGPWELKHFKFHKEDENKNKTSKVVLSHSKPVFDKEVINVEYFESASSPKVEETNSRFSIGISPLVLVRKKWKSKQSQKHVCFASNVNDKKDAPNSSQDVVKNIDVLTSLNPELELKPGKWRKSLNCLRRTLKPTLENDPNHKKLRKQYHKGRSTGVVERPKSLTATNVTGNRKSIYIRPNSAPTRTGSRSTYSLGSNDFKRQVLQRCGQRRILNFDAAYSNEYLRNCYKIGEGTFGEVFLHSIPKQGNIHNDNSEKTVLKIIPIEGKELVNGEMQKTFELILPEIIISTELCSLNDDKRQTNVTFGFVNIHKVKCVKGQYPSYLQKLWEEYDMNKESENDHPNCFPRNQQYIILELAFGGQDLEGFQFKNAEQSFYALQQIILTLAVGENEYQFEHRDLHWGNVLVLKTNQQHMSYKLGESTLTVPTKGVQITIIDYTLSRMTFNDYCLYNDLSNDDELFVATGDYQFEIYRMMRNILNNKWETFEPKTNVFWISYIISKLVEGVSYKNTRSKNHLHYLDKMKGMQASILSYKSCMDCAKDVILH